MRLKLILMAIFLWCFIPSKADLFGSIYYQQQPKKINEDQKIESLIAFIAKQDGVFIRNGSEYTPGQAAEHLRMKWKRGGKAIKTAEIFIDKLASTSSMSGKPYQIKYKNGRSINLAALLRAELKRLEK